MLRVDRALLSSVFREDLENHLILFLGKHMSLLLQAFGFLEKWFRIIRRFAALAVREKIFKSKGLWKHSSNSLGSRLK